jgi:hypothetical protein
VDQSLVWIEEGVDLQAHKQIWKKSSSALKISFSLSQMNHNQKNASELFKF